MARNAIQHLLLCVGMTPNEILHESECFPVSQSEVGGTLLLDVFAALIVVFQLFCVSSSVQNIAGFGLTVAAIFSGDSSELHSLL